ncbi:MAG: PKD domain-containing protein, partial [Bacteroidota bacterium]
DGAANWSNVATGNSTALGLNKGQGYYDLAILASPLDADQLIVGTNNMFRSTDGGVTFDCLGGYCTGGLNLHPDIQDALCVGGDCWIATDGGMYYSTDFFANSNEARNKGLTGSEFWGYSQGWNTNMFVGGRYHNGNTSWHESYPSGQTLCLGGAESATGWILHGREPEAYFDDAGGGFTLLIPQVISDPLVSSTSFTKHPNKVYGHLTSRLLTHPENAAIHFTGQGNVFWRSDDAGVNWTNLRDFGEKTWWFEMSRSNLDVIYLFTETGFHKTTDGGANWTDLTAQLPTGFGLHSNGRVTVDGYDENTLWILNFEGSNGAFVYKSTDGGMTWTNWTTPTLDDREFRTVTHVLGTNGGVYLTSINGDSGTYPAKVFYRNNTDTDWRDCSSNIPAGFNPLKLVPFYRDSKMRLAGNMGVWETDLEETFNIIAQPMVTNKTPLACLEDIKFDCYSVLDHSGANWSWSFPSASTVSSTTARNPVVQYNSPGTYTVTLTITRGVEMSTKSMQVAVGGSCPGGISSNYSIDTDKDGIPDIIENTACQHVIPQGNYVNGSN